MDRSVSFVVDRGNTAVAQIQSRSQFVGREQELGELLTALAETRNGHGRAVLIGGEPGIGKTRLAHPVGSRMGGCRRTRVLAMDPVAADARPFRATRRAR